MHAILSKRIEFPEIRRFVRVTMLTAGALFLALSLYLLSMGPCLYLAGRAAPVPATAVPGRLPGASTTGTPRAVTMYPSWFVIYAPVHSILGARLSPNPSDPTLLRLYRSYLMWWIE